MKVHHSQLVVWTVPLEYLQKLKGEMSVAERIENSEAPCDFGGFTVMPCLSDSESNSYSNLLLDSNTSETSTSLRKGTPPAVADV